MKILIDAIKNRNIFVLLFCSVSTGLLASPPSRVARLSSIEGQVSFLPAGEEEWGQARRNFSLTTGDSLWSDSRSQATLQVPRGTICIGENSNVEILNLNDEIIQLQLQSGSLLVNVMGLFENQSYEIDTPNLAFTIRTPGSYRIGIDKDVATLIRIDNGEGEVFGEKNAFYINDQQAYRFIGTDLNFDKNYVPKNADQLDRSCYENLSEKSTEKHENYVSVDLIGYDDLDEYGAWESSEEYGYVWIPNNIDADWAPYRVGSWMWVEPWGWTWVAEEPWGFAPYHYGRWALVGARWCWVPGPLNVMPVYSPALVVFASWGSDVAWFALAPGEIYVPPYPVDQNYFRMINNDAHVDRRLLSQAYANPQLNFNRNFRNQNGMTIVSQKTFKGAQLVNKNRINLPESQGAKIKLSGAPAVVPDRMSVLGTTEKAKSQPTRKILDRKVLVKSKAPSAPVPFEKKRDLIEKNQGKPLDNKALSTIEERPLPKEQIQITGNQKPNSFPKGQAGKPPVIREDNEPRKRPHQQTPERQNQDREQGMQLQQKQQQQQGQQQRQLDWQQKAQGRLEQQQAQQRAQQEQVQRIQEQSQPQPQQDRRRFEQPQPQQRSLEQQLRRQEQPKVEPSPKINQEPQRRQELQQPQVPMQRQEPRKIEQPQISQQPQKEVIQQPQVPVQKAIDSYKKDKQE